MGINTVPALNGKWATPFDLRNVDIDMEKGQLALRDGYTGDGTPVLGNQEKLVAVNFIGGNSINPYFKLYSIHPDESYMHAGHRLFIVGIGTTNRWIDAETGQAYPWREDTLTGRMTKINYRGGQDYFGGSGEGTDWTFRLCWTYANDKFGMESQPTAAYPFKARFNESNRGSFKFTFDHSTAPAWADEIRYYMTRVPQAGSISRVVAIGGETRGPIRTLNDQGVRRGPDGTTIKLPMIEGAANSLKVALPVDLMQEQGFEFVQIGGRRRTSLSVPFSNSITETFLINFIQRTIKIAGSDDTSVEIDTSSYTRSLPVLWVENPPQDFEHLLLYAGRAWGYDRNRNSIRFSFIDGNGISRYDWFPTEDVAIPHEITLEGMQESAVTALTQMPGRGGIYVFFRDRIVTIRGQALVSGLFSADLPPKTDLDASGGIPDTGTQSPNSIVNFKGSVIFLGTDKRLWSLTSNGISNIGQPIQAYLSAIPDTQLADVNAFAYENRYHINIGSRTFVFDVENKYWTSYNWNITSAVWDRGGAANASTLYALLAGNQLVRLYDGEDDAGTPISWEWESQTVTMPDLTTFSGVYIKTHPPYQAINVAVVVDGAGAVSKAFTPRQDNRFLMGFYGRGTEIKITLSGTGQPPHIQSMELEYAT